MASTKLEGDEAEKLTKKLIAKAKLRPLELHINEKHLQMRKETTF